MHVDWHSALVLWHFEPVIRPFALLQGAGTAKWLAAVLTLSQKSNQIMGSESGWHSVHDKNRIVVHHLLIKRGCKPKFGHQVRGANGTGHCLATARDTECGDRGSCVGVFGLRQSCTKRSIKPHTKTDAHGLNEWTWKRFWLGIDQSILAT